MGGPAAMRLAPQRCWLWGALEFRERERVGRGRQRAAGRVPGGGRPGRARPRRAALAEGPQRQAAGRVRVQRRVRVVEGGPGRGGRPGARNGGALARAPAGRPPRIVSVRRVPCAHLAWVGEREKASGLQVQGKP
jgi:hypothetical protein